MVLIQRDLRRLPAESLGPKSLQLFGAVRSARLARYKRDVGARDAEIGQFAI